MSKYNPTPVHDPSSFVTQPPLKASPTPAPIIDEELEYLKSLSKSAASEYFETLQNLNQCPVFSKGNPIKSHLFRSTDTFFNNDAKIQEIRRGRFIGKLLHGVSYSHGLENPQQGITEKIKKLSASNLLPEDMAHRMEKTIRKKIGKLGGFLIEFNREEERKCIYKGFDQSKGVADNVQKMVRKEIIELGVLANYLKTAVFFNSKAEEMENTPDFSLGSEQTDLIYDKLQKPKHENFTFLRESHLRDYINDLHKEKYSVTKLQKITALLEHVPQLIFFRLVTEKTSFLIDEIAKLVPSGPFLYAGSPEQAMQRCLGLAENLKLPFEFNFDNPTMLFYNIDNHFQETYQKQAYYLEFSEYILKDERLEGIEKNPTGFQDPDLLLDGRTTGLKIKKTHWIEDLQVLSETDRFQRHQRVVLDEFYSIRLFNWLKFLTMNNLEQMQLRVGRLVRDLRESQSQQKDLEEVYFEILSAYYKLLVVKSRGAISRILSYLNCFRALQKELTIAVTVKKEQNIGRPSKNENAARSSEGEEARLKQEVEERKIIEKNLFKLFEKQNKFDKYVLSSPSRPHSGLVNIVQDYEKLQKELYKLDEETIAKAMKTEENTDPFFRGLRDEIRIEEDLVIVEDYNHEKVVYDSVIHDFFDLSDELIRISAFYIHQVEKERKGRPTRVVFKEEKNPLDREEVLAQDEESLFNELLDLESRFHFEKVRLALMYREVLDHCYVSSERHILRQLLTDLMARRPVFELTRNTALESYQLALSSLSSERELLSTIIEHQKRLERETLRLSQELQRNTIAKKKEGISSFEMGGHNNDNMGLESEVKKEKEDIGNNEGKEEMFFLNEREEEKIEICASITELTGKDFLFYFEKVAKFLRALKEAEGVLMRLCETGDGIDCISRSALIGLFFQQVGFFYSKLKFNFLLFDELLDFKFLENDPVLDRPLGYEIFKREFFKQYYERADRPTRESLKQRDNSQRVIRIANNKVMVQRAEFLELMFNYMEFQRLRMIIDIRIFQIAFLIEVYKDQLKLFYEMPFYMFQAIGISSVIDNFNLLKYFIALDKLKCSSEIVDLQNWVFYMITPKRMIEPAVLLNSLLSLEVLASIGVTLNNLYIEELTREFPNENDFRKKVNGSARLFFYNIFEKKKRQVYLATTLSLVVTKNLERIRQKLKNKKNLKDTLTRMNKLDLTEKKPKRDLGILEMFCTVLQKELAFDIMKIQTIVIRTQLLRFDRKLPFPKRTFELSPLSPHDYTEGMEKDLELDVRNVLKKKTTAFFDEFGYALNIFTIPSIEEILKIIQLDFDTHQAIEYEEIFYDEDEYRLEEQLFESKEDSRTPLKKLIEKQRNMPLRKLQRLYHRKKHFTNKGFEYLEKTALFIIMNVLFSLHNVFLLEYFMNVLESHPQDIFYLKIGFLESESLIIDNNGKIPDLKKNELRIRNDLDGIKFLGKKIAENIILIKNNAKIINVNEAIMIYLQKIQRKKFNLILMLTLNEVNIVRKTQDYEFIKKLNIFICDFALQKLRNLTKINEDFFLSVPTPNPKENPFIPALFEDISTYMKLTKSLFFEYKPEFPKKLSFSNVFDRMCVFQDNLELGFIELSKSKRTQLATHLSEILTKTNEIINKRGFYELQNLFKFEKEFNHVIKINIRYNILKEAVFTLRKKSLPFQYQTKYDDFLDTALERAEAQYGVIKDLAQNQINEEKFGIILNEDRLRFRMEILANEFEKILLEESVKFYRDFNKLQKMNIVALKPNFNEMTIHKAKFLNSSLQFFHSFLQNLLQNSSEIPTVNKGPALAISAIHFDSAIHELNSNLQILLIKRVSELSQVFSEAFEKADLENNVRHLEFLNLGFENSRLRKQVDFKVEAKVSYKSYMLLYQLDYLTRLFVILKDEASLKEEQVKEAMTNDYGKSLSDYEIQLENFKSRFMFLKKMMNADLRSYIDNSKEENIKKLKKKVQELKGGLELLNLNKSDSDMKIANWPTKKITILYLFEILKRFRTFHQIKDVLAKEKFEKDLLKLNEKVISNETFMHKIRDLEIKEKGLNDELGGNNKKINFLKKQNSILTKDLAASYLDKKKLVKENSMQTEKINECFTTLEDYKKKRTIERSIDRSRMKDEDELSKKQENLRMKFAEENNELKFDQIKEKKEKIEPKGSILKDSQIKRESGMSSGTNKKKELRVNIEELPKVMRRKK